MGTNVRYAEPLASFTEAVRHWFASAFEAPTPIQEQAWASIKDGHNTLVIAPTGSGKTFAAFLSAIDALAAEKMRAAETGEQPPKGVRVLYVSPLKALGADIERNLQAPLAAIAAQQGADESAVKQITVGVRTGDTPQSERAQLVRNPPDILITTPESLYLMLTSKARETLATVETVIVDELHSMAGTKRGTHFSLSLERLDALLPAAAQRIGLSATIKPVDVAASFLGGMHPVQVVQDDSPPAFALHVTVPVEDLTHIQPATANITGMPDTRTGAATIWPYIEASVLEHVLSHRSTIVFVNSRGICERLTAQLNAAYDRMRGRVPVASQGAAEGAPMRSEMGSTTLLAGESLEPIAMAHHGSVSKDRRQEIERALKSGKLKCVVATSSLELGIDMGEVDLVIQVAVPPSVSSGLQRIGRANHQVDGRSVGIIYPRTRFEVLDAAFVVEGMLARTIEETHLIKDALDVLAQQTAAEVAMHPEGIAPKDWLATVRRSACYQDLPDQAFQAVLTMLAGAFATGSGSDLAPLVDLDRASDILRPLPRTQRLAISSAGTIPDRGLYPVMLNTGTQQKGRKRVGELDEEMVHESRVGDVIILGTSTWRITEITNDRVLVAPAPGRAARLPFWHGEGIGRSLDAGIRRGRLQAHLDAHVDNTGQMDEELRSQLDQSGFDENGINNLGALIAAQRVSTKSIPSDARILLETCPDDTGAWYLVVHSPFGKRVNEPWALAISKRVQATLSFNPECAASDDGIVMRIPFEDECAITAEHLAFAPDEITSLVSEAITNTSLFAARFRECSARALLMRPTSPGKRTPLWQQRLRGGQLLEAAREIPGFPIYLEAARECLHDVYDLEGLCWLMGQIEAHAIELEAVQTDHPSAFASPLLFGYVADHLYNGDMPHAERNRALLSVDSGLLAELLGMPDQLALLEPAALARVQLESQRLLPDRRLAGVEGVAELLRQMGPLTLEQLGLRVERSTNPEAALQALEADHRACGIRVGARELWAIPEDALRLEALTGATVPSWARSWAHAADQGSGLTEAASVLVSKLLATNALVDGNRVAAQLGCGVAVAEEMLHALKESGNALSLEVTSAAQAILSAAAHEIDSSAPLELGAWPKADLPPLPQEGTVWTTKEMLRRLRLRSRDAMEAEVQPVKPAALSQLGLTLQRIGGDPALSAMDNLAECIALFEGSLFPASLWESTLLPARVPDYRPGLLDELLDAEEVIWWAQSANHKAPAVALYPADSPFAPQVLDAFLQDGEGFDAPQDTAPDESRTPLERELLALLAAEGPLTLSEMMRRLQEASAEEAVSPHAVAQALRSLANAGQATSTSFSPLRTQSTASKAPSPRSQRRVSSRRSSRARTTAAARSGLRATMVAGQQEVEALGGRWRAALPPEMSQTELAIAQVESLLDTYGVICPKTIDASGYKGGMQAIYAVLRGMEDAGEVIRGEFVEGLGASQFARRHTVEALRAEQGQGALVVLAAADPAMLYGPVLPWPDAQANLIPGNRAGCFVVLKHGAPVLFATKHLHHLISFTEDEVKQREAITALVEHMKHSPAMLRASFAQERMIVQKVNGQDVFDTPWQQMLSDQGFIRDIHGMRLYFQPF